MPDVFTFKKFQQSENRGRHDKSETPSRKNIGWIMDAKIDTGIAEKQHIGQQYQEQRDAVATVGRHQQIEENRYRGAVGCVRRGKTVGSTSIERSIGALVQMQG